MKNSPFIIPYFDGKCKGVPEKNHGGFLKRAAEADYSQRMNIFAKICINRNRGERTGFSDEFLFTLPEKALE